MHTHNDGVYLRQITETTPCSMHGKKAGEPCWILSTEESAPHAAICGVRIRAAGFTGVISPKSLSRWAEDHPKSKKSSAKTDHQNSRPDRKLVRNK